MMDSGLALEPAHVVPGRMRLRWRGAPNPPAELLSRIQSGRGVERVEYRPSSRSLLVIHRDGFAMEELAELARSANVRVEERPPDEAGLFRPAPPRAAADGGAGARVAADLEALLLLGLMFTWARDMITSRTVRLGAVLLLILTALNLYQYWGQRRRRAREDEAGQELEFLTP